MISHKMLCIISLGLCNSFVYSDQSEAIDNETVLVTSSSNIKYLKVPTSDYPLLTWMEVRKGIFPDLTTDVTSVMNVTVGDPITLFIFYKGNSNLYDVRVTDCWAYDDDNFPLSKQKLHLCESSSKTTSNKVLSKWRKFRSKKLPSFLYASFISFKFPEKEKIFLTCDIQLIGRDQS